MRQGADYEGSPAAVQIIGRDDSDATYRILCAAIAASHATMR